MLLCGRDSSSRLGSQKQGLSANDFYYELPSHKNCPDPGSFLEVLYCVYLYAHALLTRTHIYHQTLPMLVQQSHQRIYQPCLPSTQDSRTLIIAPLWEMSRYMLSGRIGVWNNIHLIKQHTREQVKTLNYSANLAFLFGLWKSWELLCLV